MKRIKLLTPILGLSTVASLATVLTSCNNGANSGQTLGFTWTEIGEGDKAIVGRTPVYNIELNKQYVYTCKVSDITKNGTYLGGCYFETSDKDETQSRKFASSVIKVGNTTITPTSESSSEILYFEIPDSAKQTDELKITVTYSTAGDATSILAKFLEK